LRLGLRLSLRLSLGLEGYENSPKCFSISVFYLNTIFYLFFNSYSHRKSQIRKLILSKKYSDIFFQNRSGILNIKIKKYYSFLPESRGIEILLLSNNYNKRKYSTETSIKNVCSERLNIIIEEIGINPIYIFENLNSEDDKQLILNKTKGLSGIYMILNKTTKDYYIGSAATNKFYARFSNHLIYLKGNKTVKLAVKKYNLKNFAFIILELFPKIVTKENNIELLNLEDKYLKLLLPNYNILTEAGSTFGYKHIEVDRQRLKDIYKTREVMIAKFNKREKISDETIENLREKGLNKSNILPMGEVTEKRKKYITNTSRSLILYNLNGTVYGKFETIFDLAQSINCKEKTILRALNTKKGLVKRQ
jgi:group I intron endonuclease